MAQRLFPIRPLTVADYAAETGRRPSSVRRSIQRGTLYAVKVGRDWVVLPSWAPGAPAKTRKRDARWGLRR